MCLIALALSRVEPYPKDVYTPLALNISKDFKKIRVANSSSPFDINTSTPSILADFNDLFPDKINDKEKVFINSEKTQKERKNKENDYKTAHKYVKAFYGDLELSLAYFKDSADKKGKTKTGSSKSKDCIKNIAIKKIKKYETNNSVIKEKRYSISTSIYSKITGLYYASGSSYWIFVEDKANKTYNFIWRKSQWVYSIKTTNYKELEGVIEKWDYVRSYINIAGIPLTLHYLLFAIYMLLRAYIIILTMNYFNQMVSVEELKNGCLKIKAKDLAYTLPISLNILPIIRNTLVNTLVSFRLKGGFRRNVFSNIKMLIFTVIMNSVRMAEELAQVMEVNADYLFKEQKKNKE